MFLRSKGNTIRRLHRWRFLPGFVLLVMAIILFHPPDEVHASNDVIATVDKTTGDLTFVLTAKKASSSKTPHWKTIGFYVSKKATGQNGVAGTTASKCVFFDDMPASWKKDRVLDNGTVETTFTIPKENFIEMCEKAGVDQESLEASGGYVYLQGVLQGYKPSNGKALTERCYTLEQMKNTRNDHVVNGSTWKGIAWSRSCNDGWKARYDIKVTYPPVESPVTINYYQSQSGKWVLVASVTNSKDGRIEETESGGYFTKNVNTAATDYQWQSSETSYGSIVAGNGLGLSGNGTKKADGSVEYDGLYYYGKKKINTTSKSLPTKLSKVLPTGSALTIGDLDKYYLCGSKVSRVDAKMTGVVRNKASGTTYVKYTGKFTDSSGNLTDAYREYLPQIRQDFKVLKGGTVINVFYKKRPKKDIPVISEDVISGSHMEPSMTKAIIQSEERGAEQYDSVSGIPSSECQYVNVFTDEYLYEYQFHKESGEKTFHQYVSCTHTYKDPDTGETKYLHDHDSVPVTREYSYWVVDHFLVYGLETATVCNYSLPGNGELSLYPSGSYSRPRVWYEAIGGILEEPEDGWVVKEYVVCNDALALNGVDIMTGAHCETNTQAPGSVPNPNTVGKDVLYKHLLEIEYWKENGTYETEAEVRYSLASGDYVNAGDVKSYTDIPVANVNDVTILTPTICYPTLTDAREYTQLVTPGTDCYYLVLDRYFTVHLPTYGYHSDLKGYGTRDYEKFIKSREVSFPFDVYMVSGSLYTFYNANTWIELTNDDTQFYLPIWVDETNAVGMDFRCIAINCLTETQKGYTQPIMNSSVENYVAEDTRYAEVSGRLYGLELYDISDYPTWEMVFRKENSLALLGTKYAVGINDQNGSRKARAHILPLINGSHPVFINMGVQKTGYTSRFRLTTIGNIYHGTDYIKIKPRFYYVSYDGSVVQEVDLYYNETVNGQYRTMVKVGSDLDKQNVKSMTLGNVYTSVPDAEIQDKAALSGLSEKDIRSTSYPVYTYGEITVPSRMSTYVGKNYAPDGVIPASEDADKVTKSMQTWYFEYSLPSDVYAVDKGFDVDTYAREHYGIDFSEDIWKKNGYILVNFDITTYQSGFEKFSDGVETGLGSMEGEDIFEEVTETPLPRLNYTNQGNVSYGFCNMWQMEGQLLTRTDYSGNTFHFRYGDVQLYWLNRSAKQDYQSYGTH